VRAGRGDLGHRPAVAPLDLSALLVKTLHREDAVHSVDGPLQRCPVGEIASYQVGPGGREFQRGGGLRVSRKCANSEPVDPQDRRAKTIRLTRRGSQAQAAGRRILAETAFEQMLPDLDQLARGTDDLAVLRSLLGLPPRRHPCSAEDIAGIVNGDLETVQRVLVGMVRQRAAGPDR